MLLVGAKMYSISPEIFNPFESQNFMMMLKSYLCGAFNVDKPHLKDIAISCLYYLFIQKRHCLV